MALSRVVLGLSIAFILIAGLGSLIAPGSLASQAGLSTAPHALTEVRAFYGGLQIGVGLFLLWCFCRREISLGLVLVGLAVGGAAIGRTLGILLDESPTPFHLGNLSIELITVALVAVALLRGRRPAVKPAA